MQSSPVLLSPDQDRALSQILAWIHDRHRPTLSLGGFAGTGKSTLIAILRQELGDRKRVAFCSFTGKATRVLSQKLAERELYFEGDTVSTIHSLMYSPEIDDDGKILEWKKKRRLDADLIIVDEASMVPENVWKDLLSYGKPILAVGDHGQLPPVQESFNLMERPDLRLERIHRQAEGHPIIQLSLKIREEGRLPFGHFSREVMRVEGSELDWDEILPEWDAGDGLILCFTNKTRVALNKKIRALKGFRSEVPKPGERLICLRNHFKKGLTNGTLARVKEAKMGKDDAGLDHWYDVKLVLEDQRPYQGRISKYQFNQPTILSQFPGGLSSKEVGELFDFGYALTVHKAQGSQAEKVIVFEDGIHRQPEEFQRRWLYTAVTRAQEKLIIVAGGTG